MTNKPMLSVERELLDRLLSHDFVEECQECGIGYSDAWNELRALLDNPACAKCGNPTVCGKVVCEDRCYEMPAAQHQGEPVAQSEFEPDAICLESDGCPTEGAVLKRFWRENQPDPVLCEFYEAEDFPSLVRELVGHVAQLQEAAKRNVKPWEDTFPPTLFPAYIARINAEQPAPLKIGSGVTVENIGFCSEQERKPYLVFDGGGCLTEVNLINVSLVSKRQVHTIADLEAIGVRVEQPAPVAVVMPEDWEDQLFAEMSRRFDLRKQIDDDHMVYDDTQIGVEFARDWLKQRLTAK